MGTGADVVDWLSDGHTKDELLEVIQTASILGPLPVDSLEPFDGKRGDARKEKLFNLSDLGNAERLVKAHGGDIRFSPSRGKWLEWDGRRWADDETGGVMRRMKSTIREIHHEADEIKPGSTENEDERERLGKMRDKIFRHALKSEEANELNAALKLAETEPGVPVLPDDMDRDPFAFNVRNGTLNLKNGVLQRHDRADLLSKIAPVDWEESAVCPSWMNFLTEIFKGDQEMINYMARAIGYSLTGDVREQTLFFPFGIGRNGKSTLIEVIRECVGDYAQQAPRSLVQTSKNDAEKIPTDVARVKGARFVTCNELEEGKALSEGTVKSLTGGDRIVARFMHRDFFEFSPTHKLWMSGNHRPSIKGTDVGIWRRIHLIPFDVVIPAENQDSRLKEKLKKELPGILRWAVEGCLEWQRTGLCPPQAVLSAVADYREAEDTMGRFLEETCEMNANAWTSSKSLNAAYSGWSEAVGDRKPLGNKSLGNRLRERGLVSERSSSEGRGWRGIAIRAEVAS